ncbi:MAG: hypothetical protein RIT15_1197 [Pseudomonadota bacterium]|jgi:CHAT domain-containing protein
MAKFCTFIFLLGFFFLASHAPALAQTEDEQIAQDFKKISPEDEVKLRAIIATPIDKDGFKAQLEKQVQEKIFATIKLGEWPLTYAAHKEAVELFPDSPRYRNDLSWRLHSRGEFAEANAWREESIKAAKNDIDRAFYHSNAATQMYEQNRDALAREHIQKAESFLKTPPRQAWQQLTSIRTLSNLNRIKSQLFTREGKLSDALLAADEAEIHGRKAAQLATVTRSQADEVYAYRTFIGSLNNKFNVLLDLRRPQDAEQILAEQFRFLNEKHLTQTDIVSALKSAARFRFHQREFAAQERLEKQALAQNTQLKYDESDPRMTAHHRQLALAYIGLHRYKDALAQFDRLDAVVANDPIAKVRTVFALERAVVYLYNNKAAQASPLLASQAANLARQYGAGPTGKQHFFTAQASGLQGVALWRMGTDASKAQAYPLLQAAVQSMMASENVDYLENIGIRKELREMIFATYIEAAAQTSQADALAALGIADWMRGGSVQEALGDAAVRAAASNQALSDLVRQDQDARNEIKGLRNYLSGEAGGASSPLPAVAAQMRERITLLEKTRAGVQIKIKAAFPDYERLVRPHPPSTTDIQAKLQNDEALVVLQPTTDATYVWVIGKDGASMFNRAAVTNAQLTALIKRLRATLDVAGIEPNRRPAFEHAAAQELYAKLLNPVQQGLAGKASLIVAAGGVLGQIPFGVLETSSAPKTIAMKDAPWLIKQAAITHVPSVAAWLSMRTVQHKSAPEPMLAWGDPLFNLALASTVKSVSGDTRKVSLTRASSSNEVEVTSNSIKYADIPSLPETRDELLAIAKTLGANVNKDLIFGNAATRDSVLIENKNGNLYKQRVVAFATHGLMAGDLPNLMQPALAMAGTKDDATNILAPLLTLEDVLTLKLNADWVVLSACNTAAADGKAEEALSGLARGFFYAGSRSMLVTHWAVDSESAVILTTQTFHNNQTRTTEAKAESLRKAMLTVMNTPNMEHPTYWAPYALVGDGAR